MEASKVVFINLNGVTQNPLASFRGNRFNIHFYDAGVLFAFAPLVEKIFREVWQYKSDGYAGTGCLFAHRPVSDAQVVLC